MRARRRRRGANAAERSALYYQALKEIAEGRYAPYEQRKGRKPAERINRALVEGVKQCNVCLRRKQLDEFKARPALRAGTAACKKCLLQIECTARRAARRGGNSQIARRECRERIRSEAAGG